MHERGLAEELLRLALKKAGGTAVKRVEARVGELNAANPESLRLWFGECAAGTVCEGSFLHIIPSPVGWSCSECSLPFEGDDPSAPCPSCGSHAWDMTGGDELLVEKVECE